MTITQWVDERLEKMTDRIIERVVKEVVEQLAEQGREFVAGASKDVTDTVTSGITTVVKQLLGPFGGFIR